MDEVLINISEKCFGHLAITITDSTFLGATGMHGLS